MTASRAAPSPPDRSWNAVVGGDSWTALIWPSRSGPIDAIRLLLDAGADVNLPGPTSDAWDATPLQHAILQRQAAAVRLLLDRGADPNRDAGTGSVAPLLDPTVEDRNGATPLSRAFSGGTLHGPDRPMCGGCRVETVRAIIAHNPQLRMRRNSAWDDAI